MFRTDRPYSKVRQRTLFGGLFLFAMILQFLARNVSGFAEGYAVTVYPVIMRTLGSVSGLVPFAVDELFIYILLFCLCGYVAAGIRRMWKKQIKIRQWLGITFSGIVKIGILWFFVFTVNCGINRIDKTAARIVTQENGLCALPEQMREKTRDAMEELGEKYPQLSGWYPKAKPVIASAVLSLESLEGVSGPYTMEAHYNPDIPAHNQPAVLCHELSHLKGFMREDEANYIAYLACIGAEDANLQYSGLLLAYTHSINALYRADYDRFLKVRSQLCSQAELDYTYHRYYWAQFEGPVSEISDRVNDTYLKANAQKEGSRSYGRMVDLLLGEYRQTEEKKNG